MSNKCTFGDKSLSARVNLIICVILAIAIYMIGWRK